MGIYWRGGGIKVGMWGMNKIEGSEVTTNCGQLKINSLDGKLYQIHEA